MIAHILVVDDEPDLEVLIKQKFRKKIRQDEYAFWFAANGVEALAQLEAHPEIDVLLSDINMPEMDGLTLLGRISKERPLVQSVIVSAYGDMENIRSAMNLGAYDFVTKPINFEDLTITVEKTLKHSAQIKATLLAAKENLILKMYVDESVLRFMGSYDHEKMVTASEGIEATVAFVDICGFTKISEVANPELVIRMLNVYFDVMAKEIVEFRGFIDKFIGDAIMAVFRGEHHLDRAIEAALAIRNRMKAMPAFEESGYQLEVSIGIDSGQMIYGNIGSASLKRLDFTVIGDTVNTAARLQDAAEPSQILITASSHARVAESFNCLEIGEVVMKNKALPISVFAVVD